MSTLDPSRFTPSDLRHRGHELRVSHPHSGAPVATMGWRVDGDRIRLEVRESIPELTLDHLEALVPIVRVVDAVGRDGIAAVDIVHGGATRALRLPPMDAPHPRPEVLRASWDLDDLEDLLFEEDYAGVIQLASTFSALHRESYRYWSALTQSLARLGREAEALEAGRRWEEVEHQSSQPLYEQTFVLESLGRHDEAYATAQRLCERDPSALSYVRLSWAAIKLARGAEAYRAAKRAVELDPECEAAWACLGRRAYDLGLEQEAVSSLRRAVELERSVWNIHELAVTLSGLGHTEEAEQLYREELVIEPGYAIAWTSLARLLARTDRVDEGCATLRRRLAVAPHEHALRVRLSELLQEHGKIDEALAEIRAALDRFPATAALWSERARLLREVEDFAGAVAAAERAVALDPIDAKARLGLAWALHGMDRAAEGLVHAREASRLAPHRRGYLEDHSAIACLAGEWEEGLQLAYRAIDAAPEERGPRDHLAWLLAWSERYLEAHDAARARQERFPDDPESYVELVASAYLAEIPVEPQWVARVRELEQADPLADLADGYARLAERRWADARDALRRAIDRGSESCRTASMLGVALVELGEPGVAQAILEGRELGKAKVCTSSVCPSRRRLARALAR